MAYSTDWHQLQKDDLKKNGITSLSDGQPGVEDQEVAFHHKFNEPAEQPPRPVVQVIAKQQLAGFYVDSFIHLFYYFILWT